MAFEEFLPVVVELHSLSVNRIAEVDCEGGEQNQVDDAGVNEVSVEVVAIQWLHSDIPAEFAHHLGNYDANCDKCKAVPPALLDFFWLYLGLASFFDEKENHDDIERNEN